MIEQFGVAKDMAKNLKVICLTTFFFGCANPSNLRHEGKFKVL